MFYLSASSLYLGGGILLTDWHVPSTVAWIVSSIGGAIFGFAMADLLVRLPKLDRLYKAAPVNGATGAAVSIIDVWPPYFMMCLGASAIWPAVQAARIHHHVPPYHIPHAIVWLAPVLLVVMLTAFKIASKLRDPKEAAEWDQELERERQEALETNERLRRVMIEKAPQIVALWREQDGNAVKQFDRERLNALDHALCIGLCFPLPNSRSLEIANRFLIDVVRGMKSSPPQVARYGLFGKVVDSIPLDEAIGYVDEIAGRLEAKEPIDIPEVCRITGHKPPASGE
jgi:hypothetical protein